MDMDGINVSTSISNKCKSVLVVVVLFVDVVVGVAMDQCVPIVTRCQSDLRIKSSAMTATRFWMFS